MNAPERCAATTAWNGIVPSRRGATDERAGEMRRHHGLEWHRSVATRGDR